MTEVSKTSDEILNELFDSINVLQKAESDTDDTTAEKRTKRKSKRRRREEDKDGKKSKRRKKHKHKKSKSKEKKRDKDKKKQKKEKDDKRPCDESRDQSPPDEARPVDEIPLPPAASPKKDDKAELDAAKFEDSEYRSENRDQNTAKSLINSTEKPKMSIKITNLKNSNLLEIAEERAKLIAEKSEEGELSTSEEESSAKHKKVSSSLASLKSSGSSSAHRDSFGHENNGKAEKDRRHSEKSNHKVRSKELSKEEVSPKKSKDESEKSTERDPSKDKKSSRKRSHSKESKRSSRPRRSRSHSRGHKRSRTKSKTPPRDKKPEEARPKEKDKENLYKVKEDEKEGSSKHRSRSRDRRSKSHERKRFRSRSRSRRRKKDEKHKSRDRYPRRSRSPRKSSKYRSDGRSNSKDEFFIDKSKLLEIARKNALNMMKQGQVGTDLNKVAAITAGGKTVDELTDFCKLLSQKEATGQESVSSESSSDNENERPFHHPFQLKERPNNIVMNIRNCAALPVKSHQEKTTEHAQQLRLQFPVSSGQHHRKTESEWVPVVGSKASEMKAIMPPSPKPETELFPLSKEPAVENPTISFANIPLPPSLPPAEDQPQVQNNYALGAVISERLAAIRKQQEVTNALLPYQQIDLLNKVQMWPGAENQAGLFTGSTGARVLSQAELASGQQAWARKDQLISAQPVCGGMGMSLLQKMGWRPGEGLGKNNEGTLEPLKLQVKMDKRGLVCAEELPKKQRVLQPPIKPPNTKNGNTGNVKSIEGKHPVSLLVEYCTRRHYPPPVFTVCSEEGPAHKKNFIFKVTVNGIDYLPASPSPNKKQAKSEAASLCLKKLGLLPFAS
ncbi:protein SON isoform X2 [Cimex lectularius]|uniref:Protein SON n=1 Tax=Cimex lectularius TaxID=79782 RepID=A0A8I6S1F6_CIMLE|nr:protein SON isoform X2 [Cimex lectularius]